LQSFNPSTSVTLPFWMLKRSSYQELTTQIQSVVLALGDYMNVQSESIRLGEDIKKLEYGQRVDVVSGTPGCVFDTNGLQGDRRREEPEGNWRYGQGLLLCLFFLFFCLLALGRICLGLGAFSQACWLSKKRMLRKKKYSNSKSSNKYCKIVPNIIKYCQTNKSKYVFCWCGKECQERSWQRAASSTLTVSHLMHHDVVLYLLINLISYANRAARFISSYGQGLTGPEAAWALGKP
jgi:hypothetical protein